MHLICLPFFVFDDILTISYWFLVIKLAKNLVGFSCFL